MRQPIEFNDETIQALFGAEAAEDEDPARLKQYYFKSDTYRNIVSDLPLRIIVGHKGIGKSALITVAIQEDFEKGRLPILIQPNDITKLSTDSDDFLQNINTWKEGLNAIIASKALTSLGAENSDVEKVSKLRLTGKLASFLIETIGPLHEKLLNLGSAKALLVTNFLKSSEINVYIDDLDRGWEGKKRDISKISALLNAIRDINNENKNIRFKIALRSDVYFLVRTSDESTDKTESAVVWYSWTNHEILALLVKRIETFFGRTVLESALIAKRQQQLAKYLEQIMDGRFMGRGRWQDVPMHQVLMSLIRKRPRDLVKLCTLAAKNAYKRKSTIIQAVDFQSIFEDYSQGRIQDTVNEYRSELPDIERLIMGMKPTKKGRDTASGYTYTTENLLKKISNICEQGVFKFKNGQTGSSKELAQFLYKINFLTGRKELPNGEIIRKYFEENRYISGKFADFGFDWEVHPAYRWALQPDTLDNIFNDLQMSSDEAWA